MHPFAAFAIGTLVLIVAFALPYMPPDYVVDEYGNPAEEDARSKTTRASNDNVTTPRPTVILR